VNAGLDAPDNMVVIGKISGVFGVRGQVKVFSYTEPRENILKYDPWMLGSGDNWKSYQVISGKLQGKGLIAQLKGCDDRDQAQLLVGQEIVIEKSQLPETKAGEFYWSDLEGLSVITTEQIELGKVSHLFETGSNDVLVVKGEREHLIPYIKDQVIRQIDLDTGQIVVDWDPEF
jgi:16S rRNA processing protein RimM